MMSNPPDDWLTPEARRLLDAPKAERLTYLQRDQWGGYPKAKETLGLMSAMFSAPERYRTIS